MSLTYKRLVHRFPNRRKDVQKLHEACLRNDFTDAQLQYLCDNVLMAESDGAIVDHFLQLEEKGHRYADAFLLSLISPQRVPVRTQWTSLLTLLDRVFIRPFERP